MKPVQKNVTFSLPQETILQVREMAVRYECSMNMVVKDALDAWALQAEQRDLAAAMLEAAADPLFLADMQEVADDFAFMDKLDLAEPVQAPEHALVSAEQDEQRKGGMGKHLSSHSKKAKETGGIR